VRRSIATIVVAADKNVIVSNYLIYLVFVLSICILVSTLESDSQDMMKYK